MRIRQETYDAVFGTVYLGLATNVLLTVTGLPVVVLLVTTDPARSWPLLALLAPLLAPGVCAAFTVFAGHRTDVVRGFVAAWRRAFRKAALVGAGTSGLLVVLAVDIRAAWGHQIGALVIPVLVLAMLLVAATALLTLVVLAERPAARVRDAVRASVYLAVRRWYLTLLSLAVLGLFELLLATRPALALGLAAAPLLFVIWAGSRFSLNPALGTTSPEGLA